jgi:hypothetical protein
VCPFKRINRLNGCEDEHQTIQSSLIGGSVGTISLSSEKNKDVPQQQVITPTNEPSCVGETEITMCNYRKRDSIWGCNFSHQMPAFRMGLAGLLPGAGMGG